jgi:hypothetical protein
MQVHEPLRGEDAVFGVDQRGLGIMHAIGPLNAVTQLKRHAF